MFDLRDLKERASTAIEAQRPALIELSLAIHANPELAFQEFRSAALLCDALAGHGFVVNAGSVGWRPRFAGSWPAARAPGRRWLCSLSMTPCRRSVMLVDITSSARRPSARAIGLAAVMAELPGRVVGDRHAGRRGRGRQGDPAGARRFCRRGRGHDGASIQLDHGQSHVVGLDAPQGRVHRQGFARGRVARRRHQCPRSRYPHLQQRQCFAPAPEVGCRGCTASSPTAAPRSNIIPDYADGRCSACARPRRSYADEVMRRVVQCAEAAGIATGAQLKMAVKPGYAEDDPEQRHGAGSSPTTGVPSASR